MGRLLKTLTRDLQRQTAPLAPAFVIINDYEEKGWVEKKATKKEEQVQRPIEIEQCVKYSLGPVEGGFLDIKVGYHDVPVVVPTKSQSKYMMKHKGKEQVEEGSSPIKVTHKMNTC